MQNRQSIEQLLENAQAAELQGNASLALQLFSQAHIAHPKELSLQIKCGNLCVQLGRFEEAAGYFRRIMRMTKSDNARNALCYAVQALGNEAHGQGKYALAAAAFEEALSFQPNNAIFWYNLGNAQRELGQAQLALASFKQAIKLDPNDADFYNNLGNVQRELGQLDVAIASYEKALRVNPDLHHALVHLVHQKQHICDWQGLPTQIQQVRDLVNTNPQAQVSPFAFLSMPGTTAAEQKRCASQYVAQNYASFFAMRDSLNFTYTKNKKLKIGYLSADFRLHPLAFLITELIEHHDRNQFEIYAYSAGIDDKSAARKRLVNAFDHFIDIKNINDIEAAKRINADGVDILIDLTGFTQSSRTGIAALKPAPISINWLGYPGSMGEHAGKPLFDYLLADHTIAPHQDNFSEKLLYLPCYQPNGARLEQDGKLIKITLKSDHFLPENAFVFCSFNQTFKITSDIFTVWMRLLAKAHNSVLWLLDCNTWAKANLLREAATAGIDKNRLIFAPRVDIAQHLARHTHADLFLDTLPYNAHTTASDALYMGLPVLTCMGETLPARVAASLLQAIDLKELICDSLQRYEEKALALASNKNELMRIKQHIAAKKITSTLFNSAHFARELEAILLTLVLK